MFSTLYFILFLDYSIHFFNDHKSKRKSCLLKALCAKHFQIFWFCVIKRIFKECKRKGPIWKFRYAFNQFKKWIDVFPGMERSVWLTDADWGTWFKYFTFYLKTQLTRNSNWLRDRWFTFQFHSKLSISTDKSFWKT